MKTDTFKVEYTETLPVTEENENYGSVGVVIVAAGTASRMEGQNKILASVSGVPVIVRTVRAFENISAIKKIVIVTRQDMIADLQSLLLRFEISKVSDIVCGGSSRPRSAKIGFELLEKDEDIKVILVHDGARPFVSKSTVTGVINAAEQFGAAIPAVPVKDTVKKIGRLGRVKETPKRENLVLVQTPQGFSKSCYRQSLDKAGDNIDEFTDDSALVENAGFSVYTTKGEYTNIKITTPEDLIMAKFIAEGSEL